MRDDYKDSFPSGLHVPRMRGTGVGQSPPSHAREKRVITRERLETDRVDSFLKYNTESDKEHEGVSITPASMVKFS